MDAFLALGYLRCGKWDTDFRRRCRPSSCGRFVSAWNDAGHEYVEIVMERISVDADVCNGWPVVRGTRIAVQTVLEFLAAGDSTDDLLAEYPSLAREDVQACLDFASRVVANRYSVVAVA